MENLAMCPRYCIVTVYFTLRGYLQIQPDGVALRVAACGLDSLPCDVEMAMLASMK